MPRHRTWSAGMTSSQADGVLHRTSAYTVLFVVAG